MSSICIWRENQTSELTSVQSLSHSETNHVVILIFIRNLDIIQAVFEDFPYLSEMPWANLGQYIIVGLWIVLGEMLMGDVETGWLSIGIWGKSRSIVQTLFYGLRKSRKNAIPIASFSRCDITMSHVYLICVLHYNTARWIHLCGNTLRMSCYLQVVQCLLLYIVLLFRHIML